MTSLKSGARDLPERQQTLHNTIEWSYDLLDDPAKRCSAAWPSSSAAGRWTWPRPCATSTGDLGSDVLDEIEVLADNSLLTQSDEADEPRFGLLSTIREYAQQHLIDSGEAMALQERHARYMLQSAQKRARICCLPGAWSGCRACCSSRIIFARRWFGAAITLPSWKHVWPRPWSGSGILRAHQRRPWYLEHALQRAGEIEAPAPCRAILKFAAGAAAAVQGDYVIARDRLIDSVAALRQSGDQRRLAYADLFLGLTDSSQGDPQTGLRLLRESLTLFRQVGDRWGEAYTLSSLGDMIVNPEDVDVLRPEIEEGLTLWRALGDTWGIGHQLVTTGSLAWYDGNYATAVADAQEAIDLLRQHSDKWELARGLGWLGFAVLYLGDVHQARVYFVKV